ncbi:MAG TPA: Wzz/FepE/Etk N-terminal domain-containing protein [Solirubrobacteraceae bacterium]|jgi:capsular polysaccharide biosynthesis protein|nr:Wzz/FepE/Etk N-terminal domain-containing protein [Solirubrobacteraceae bacterium]
MEVAEIVRVLRSRWKATLAIVVLALGAAFAVRASVASVPTGAATVQILVDSPDSALANLSQETGPLTTRASVFAQVMTSAAVLEDIATTAGVPVAQITAEGPYSGTGEPLDVVTPSEARANQLLAQTVKYRLTFLAQTDEPVVTASVQGPNAAAAARVAGSILPGVQRYVATLQQQSATPPQHRVTIRELGPPQAGSVNSSTRSTLTVAAFLGVLIIGLLALLGVESARRRARERAALESEHTSDFEGLHLFAPASSASDSHHPPAVVRAGSASAERRR